MSGYLVDDRRVRKTFTTFRLGLQNIYDVVNGNSRYRITGATSFNTTTRKPNYIYRSRQADDVELQRVDAAVRWRSAVLA